MSDDELGRFDEEIGRFIDSYHSKLRSIIKITDSQPPRRIITGKRRTHNIDQDLYDMPEFGDVKTSLLTVDHSGWYKLDGRSVTALPSGPRNRAISLGYPTVLPDSTGCFLKGGAPGLVTGSSTVTLTRDQLPNVTLSGSTSTNGSHTHTLRYPDGGSGTTTPGTQSNDTTGSIPYPGDASIWAMPAGDHSHTFTTESLNGGVPQVEIDISPKSYSVNYFLWLGL